MAGKMTQSSASGERRRWIIVSSLLLVGVAAVLRLMGGSPATVSGMPVVNGIPGFKPLAAGPLSAFIVDWDVGLARDLFDASLFAPPPSTQPAAVVKPEGPTVQMLIADVRANLSLRATMIGPRPIAIINGQTHHIGDVVGGYRITRIEQRRIVVSRDGIDLEMTCE